VDEFINFVDAKVIFALVYFSYYLVCIHEVNKRDGNGNMNLKKINGSQ
jgi:hypothetical protein